MTEGNGHVIDPGGEARRALQEVVAAHGTQALSNAVIMDGVCRDRLGGLPGEVILIGSAARSDVPALLRERIGREGTYGAIQSVAAALAQADALDLAACLWVVREFARALGFVASGGTRPTPTAGAGAGPGPGPGAGGLADQGDAMPPRGAAPPGAPAGGAPAGGAPAGGAPAGGASAGGASAGAGHLRVGHLRVGHLRVEGLRVEGLRVEGLVRVRRRGGRQVGGYPAATSSVSRPPSRW